MVTFTRRAAASAQGLGLDVAGIVRRSLMHIDALLPGPRVRIDIALVSESQRPDRYHPHIPVIPATGVGSATNHVTGVVTIVLDPSNRALLRHSMTASLPVALSHEVDHAVRVLGGAGANRTLLSWLADEGVAFAFDRQAWPASSPQYTRLTADEQRELWTTMRPHLLTDDPTAYNAWFFGVRGVFAMSDLLVHAYLNQHPSETAASIVHIGATDLLDGSRFSP